MASNTLFLILALAFISGSQPARILDESDSKVQTDPCSLKFKPLYCYIPLTSPSPRASPVVTPSPPAAPFDPCSLIFKPLYCYWPKPSPSPPASPATPVVTPLPATPVVTPSPPATPVVTPSPPATAMSTCTPAFDLIQNCGAYFYISRIAHDSCCQEVNAMSDSCLDNHFIFNLIERELLSIAKRNCGQVGSNGATETLVISP